MRCNKLKKLGTNDYFVAFMTEMILLLFLGDCPNTKAITYNYLILTKYSDYTVTWLLSRGYSKGSNVCSLLRKHVNLFIIIRYLKLQVSNVWGIILYFVICESFRLRGVGKEKICTSSILAFWLFICWELDSSQWSNSTPRSTKKAASDLLRFPSV